ncbi:MAG: isoleucine--tRNA ligase, partial [Patescibacteria group bacterium]|nr:isoleucine--tRNA ligase [Patescibacteria group bacterium]
MINFSKIEEKILAFWDKDKTFAKSLAKKSPKGNFVFFEGPPTANGLPGIHHVLARIFKDIILRYKTMQGYFVERKAGWDTQGLPVELEVEKQIGVSGKPDIEKYGVAKFNEKCKENVWKYKKEWEDMTRRIGFWLDLEHPYITYEKEYIETLWWIFKQVWDKGLIYQAYKVVPYCPRCGTALSSHEVAQGYKNVKEQSVYLKLKVVGQENTYLLVWTTTPWTLPSNLAVAAGERIEYVKAKSGQDFYILAKNLVDKVLGAHGYEIVEEFKGDKIIGWRYEPMYKIYDDPTYFKVYAADFVSIKDGTGMVHIAPHYGEEDYQLFIQDKLPIPEMLTLDLEGKLVVDVPGKGKFAKDADADIMEDLKKRGILFGTELYAHDYPFCWRCDSPLLYYSRKSWFIRMTELQKQLLDNAKEINWVPAHIKEGRFGEWLSGIKDWAISRERYWGTPIPIWECKGCQHRECLGSYKELSEKAGKQLPEPFDPHKPYIDDYTWNCPGCGKKMTRVAEVMDCWFDSGAMPFAQWHYPFENKERIDKGINYPAEYISEAIDQTRGWFYTLLGISTLLDQGACYKNAICLGHILDKKGQKMSKHVGNVIAPMSVINEYGVDALRWYLYTVNQPGESKLFDTEGVKKVVQRMLLTLWNCLEFYKLTGHSLPSNIEAN